MLDTCGHLPSCLYNPQLQIVLNQANIRMRGVIHHHLLAFAHKHKINI